MTTEILRHAATLMREQHGPEHVRHEMWQAMADWLDLTAETPAFRAFADHVSGSSAGKNIRAALAVARAYLGEEPAMRADLRETLRYRVCHENVVRQGEEQPCDKTAVALRIDPTEGNPYPVCAYHARAVMVPLADVAAAARAARAAAVEALCENSRIHCHVDGDPEYEPVGLVKVTPSGRVWNPETWMWVQP